MKIGNWSSTPGSNSSAPPDGAPEGMAPSTVNDIMREMMAQVRTYCNDAQYFDNGAVPSFLTTTTFSLNAADTTTFHVGRRLKLYDATTQYGTINSVSSTFVSVQLDPGMPGLTVSLSSVAVAAISEVNNSLPESVFTRRNMIINGAMDIWQRSTSFTPANNAATFTADRWDWVQSASCSVNISRADYSANAANVPTILQAGQLFASSLRISVSAADAAIAAGEYAILETKIEGYDWRKIAHRPNVLSFWCKSNKSGIYAVALRSTSFSASMVMNYTISAINTWSRFAVTFDEAPTTVTWNYDTGMGVNVAFCLGGGSTYQAGAGNWTATNAFATSTMTNFVGTVGNVFYITGVQLELGKRATPFEVRHHAAELALAQRYYWRGTPAASFAFGAYTTGAVMCWPCAFPAQMRVTPTVALTNAGMTLNGLAGTPAADSPTLNGFRLVCTASAAGGPNFIFNANDYIEATADL